MATKKPAAKKPAPKKAAAPVKKTLPAKKAAPVKKAVPAKKAAPKPAAKKAVAKTPVKKAPVKANKPVAKVPVKSVNKKKPVAKVAPKAAPKKAPVPQKQIKPLAKNTDTKKVAVKNAPAKPAAKVPAKPVAKIPAKPVPAAKPAEKAPTPKAIEKAPLKAVPAKPAVQKPVVMPKITAKSARKYEPDFTKSVLDQKPADPGAPVVMYGDNDLAEFRELIQRKLGSAKKELAYLQGLITRKDDMGGDEGDNRYMTMEDGSLSMEREQLSQMASRQITFIDHLEKALMRIENKTYGVCRITGKLIDKARLRAVPHATLSIEAKMNGGK
jgi:RNA polymerase-binding transcription factor DksA